MPTALDWPICAAMLQFPAVDRAGRRAQDATPDEWRAALGTIARAGFDAVELTDGWIDLGALSTDRLAALRDAAADAGLRTPTVNIVRRSVIDARDGDGNLAHGHRMIDAAAELGMDLVCASLHQSLTDDQRSRLWFWTGQGHVDPEDAEVRELATSRLRELGRHAGELGMKFSLELYEDTYLGSSESAVRLVQDIDLPNVGLNPDIGNLIRLHRPVEDWYDIAAATLPYANYWHVKNYARDEDREHGVYLAVPTYLEAGIIDYRTVTALAIELGFDGWICCESYGGDGLSVSAANREYLRRILPV